MAAWGPLPSAPLESPLSQLGRIFTPSRAVPTSERLIHRSDELRDLFIALSGEGEIPVLLGPPGTGKTSVLNVASDILAGLEREAPTSFYANDVGRVVLYLRCTRHIAHEGALAGLLLERLVRALSGGEPKVRHLRLRDFSVKASAPIGELSATWEAVARPDQAVSAMPELLRALQSVPSHETSEVIIMLDECEQLPWLENLLDWTREFEEIGCKFVLAMRDYAFHRLANPAHGDYRWPLRVDLAPFELEHVINFYEQASVHMQELGVPWNLTEEALRLVTDRSNGEPWYLQMVGHELIHDRDLKLESLVNSTTRCAPITVRPADVRAAEQRVARTRLSSLHQASYLRLTRGAPDREELLRSMAIFPETLIPFDFVTDVVGVRVPLAKKMVRNFCRMSTPPVVVSEVGGGALLEFGDHQFRVFCRLTSASSEGIEVLAQQHVDSWLRRTRALAGRPELLPQREPSSHSERVRRSPTPGHRQ